MGNIVDGKQIAEEIAESLKLKVSEIASYGHRPELAVVLVGENPASLSYIKIKKKQAENTGIDLKIYRYPVDVSEADLISEIEKLNAKPLVCGIIVQLPLPAHMDRQKILDAVQPELDIDCLATFNKQRLIEGKTGLDPYFVPPAARAVLKILEYYNVELKGKNVLLIGSGDLIGKPLSAIFLKNGIAFGLANRHTENLPDLAGRADVIITGVGKENLITADMIKEGAVVIDAGTTGSDEGGIVGDVDRSSVEPKASLLAPVPGGVGPVTVAVLLENFVKAANRKLKISH